MGCSILFSVECSIDVSSVCTCVTSILFISALVTSSLATVFSIASVTVFPILTFISVPSAFISVPSSFTDTLLTNILPSVIVALPINVTLLPFTSATSIVASPVSLAIALPSSVYVFPCSSV